LNCIPAGGANILNRSGIAQQDRFQFLNNHEIFDRKWQSHVCCLTLKFAAPPGRVFDAALRSIAAQPYEIAAKNEENKTVRFTVGKSAFSWGYVTVLSVLPGAGNTSNVSVEVTPLRGPDGKVSIVGSGKKEVQKGANRSGAMPALSTYFVAIVARIVLKEPQVRVNGEIGKVDLKFPVS